MPPPIVPAPTTAARLMSAAGVSFGTSGTLAASRSAKNRCRSAFDSVETTHSAKISRSRRDPSSKRQRQRRLDGVDGGERRADALRRLRARAHRRDASRPACDCLGSDGDLAGLARSRLAAAFSFANAIAPASRSPSTTCR